MHYIISFYYVNCKNEIDPKLSDLYLKLIWLKLLHYNFGQLWSTNEMQISISLTVECIPWKLEIFKAWTICNWQLALMQEENESHGDNAPNATNNNSNFCSCLFAIFYSCHSRDDIVILVIGLDNAGKSTLISTIRYLPHSFYFYKITIVNNIQVIMYYLTI